MIIVFADTCVRRGSVVTGYVVDLSLVDFPWSMPHLWLTC